MRRRSNGWMGWVVVLVLAACGGSERIDGPDPNAAFAPFVGTWDAEAFTITSDADSTLVADLLIDGSFFIVFQPSGIYTATLSFGDVTAPLVEIGQISVSGNIVTLMPTNLPPPCPAASTFSFPTPDFLILDGPTCFDFNLDGEDEDAQAHLELRRRP